MTSSFGPYASFIVGSYALVALVVAALIVGTIVDYRRQTKRLRELDRAGVTRRSGRHASDAA